MKYGTPSGRVGRCQRCYIELEVDELGRVPQHRKRIGSGFNGTGNYSTVASIACPKSGHPSREELQRRKVTRHQSRLATAAAVRDDARVALDAFIEGVPTDYDKQRPEWLRAALAVYNQRHATKHPHLYEYATTCAVASRRANTRGDIYCRFCGERLLVGVKDPHVVVRNSPDVQRHLTICALQLLAEMREPAKPGTRRVPMEELWF